tara:strand:+ start:757 stop:1188 length:432 start_codon:yes stop_codon:yes gene_type:complete
MGIGAVKKVLKKPTEGQKKVEPAVKQQRAYGKGQLKAAGATGLTAAALAGMSLKELRAELKKAKLEEERAKIKAAIEKTLREMATKDKDKKMNRGGVLKTPSADQTGLKKLPSAVRNKMGYMNRGGMVRNGHADMRKGGMFYK